MSKLHHIQWIREYLKESGVNWRNYRIRCPKNSKGEYDTTTITILDMKEAVNHALELSQFFTVVIFISSSNNILVTLRTGGKGLEVYDFTRNIHVVKGINFKTRQKEYQVYSTEDYTVLNASEFITNKE